MSPHFSQEQVGGRIIMTVSHFSICTMIEGAETRVSSLMHTRLFTSAHPEVWPIPILSARPGLISRVRFPFFPSLFDFHWLDPEFSLNPNRNEQH